MNEENKYELVKFIEGNFELEVSVDPKEETIWMTQSQIAKLFEKSKSTINEHIKNILKFELNESEVIRKFGKSELSYIKTKPLLMYNLDLILAVGYRVNSKKGIQFRRWANSVLKEYLLKGYTINENRVIVNNDNFNNLALVVNDIKANQININNRLQKIEDKVMDKEYGLDKIFYNGEFYDAYTLVQGIFESARKEIIIIDNYIDRTILDRLVVKNKNVCVIIYTNITTSKLLGVDIQTFNKQYSNLTIIYTTKVHDRYIIIDQTKLYHLGHSIKDLGKKIFSISESDNNLIGELLNNL